jgi:23S rRNA pseudouridine1911/1915/1917 synthase
VSASAVTATAPEAKPFRRADEPPRVVLQREEFALIYKPAHLLIHPTRPTGEPTLLDWLRAKKWGATASLVNRLDRETSGLVLAALNPSAASLLGKMMMRRAIRKDYVGIVWGSPAQKSGTIDAPIGRIGINPQNSIYLKRGVMAEGARAQTEYHVLAGNNQFSLLLLRAHTGRLHQLRVHLAHIGCPLVGDKIYGPNPELYLKFITEGWTAQHQKQLLLDRHALHALRVRFEWNGEPVETVAPLPDDLARFAETKIGAVPL